MGCNFSQRRFDRLIGSPANVVLVEEIDFEWARTV
jgi:hypothetical protein